MRRCIWPLTVFLAASVARGRAQEPHIHFGIVSRSLVFIADCVWDTLTPQQRQHARDVVAEKCVAPYYRLVLQTYHWAITHDIGWMGQGLESGLPGYWSVSMQNLYTAAAALHNVKGIDLRVHPGFEQATYYPIIHETTVPPVRHFKTPIDPRAKGTPGILSGKPIELPHGGSGGAWWFDYTLGIVWTSDRFVGYGAGRESLVRDRDYFPLYVRPTWWLLPQETLGHIELELLKPETVDLVRLLNTSNAGLNDYATHTFRVELYGSERTLLASREGAFGKACDGPFRQAFVVPQGIEVAKRPLLRIDGNAAAAQIRRLARAARSVSPSAGA